MAPKSPLFCPRSLTKAPGCGRVEDGGGRRERSRFPIEYLAGMNWRGASPLGCKGTRHTHSHTHTHSGGFWCQLLASSSTNDPRLTHIVSHVWGFPLSRSPVETLSYGCSLVLPAFSAGTALGAPCGLTLFTPTQGQWSCWQRERDREKRRRGRQRERDWDGQSE